MPIQTHVFDSIRYDDTGDLFPSEIEDDRWIAYHGTSTQFSDAIECSGLEWKPTLSRDAVRRLVAVFEGIDWCGKDTDGFGVLATYTQFDFGGAAQKPVFLAQSAGRGVLYAERDWAGGETARGCRRAFADLDLWVAKPEIHAELRRGCGIPDCLPGINPCRPALSVSWVQERLSELEGVRKHCELLLQSHLAGVVYAVRMTREFIPFLEREGGAGYACNITIPPSMIVGKVIVPADIKCRRLRRGDSKSTIQRLLSADQHPDSLESVFRKAHPR